MKTTAILQGLFFLSILLLISCKKEEPKTLAAVSTTEVSTTIANSVLVRAKITDDGGSPIRSCGVAWHTAPEATIFDNMMAAVLVVDSFNCLIEGLDPGMEYYFRAYAVNSEGLAYGNEISIETNDTLPEAYTTGVADIEEYSAIVGGSVHSDGGSTVSSRGFVWDTASAPTLEDWKLTAGSGTGCFIGSLEDLIPNTMYYVRAYAVNDDGTKYGNELSFVTKDTTQWILVFSDDFEDYTTGSHPSAQWVTRFSGESAAISEDVSFEGTKSFRLSSKPNWARVEAVPLDSVADEMRYEGAVYIDSPDKGYVIGFGFKESGNTYRYRNIVGFTNGGRIGFFCGDTMDYATKTWYQVRTEIDFVKQKAKFWLDGKFIYETSECFTGKDGFNDFVLGGYNFSTGTSTAYYDDIKIFVRKRY
ncbi:fibronectin type III domain-containing protein [Bacteroidota bacterium]